MKMQMNRRQPAGALRIFAAVPAAALLISCPKLIPDEIALAIQDQFAPRISITSPENGSDFDAKLEIKGILKDDALVPGDGRGILSYLAVSAGRNPEHNGAVRITPNGKTIIESRLKESASVEYSAADGSFKITIKKHRRSAGINQRRYYRQGPQRQFNYQESGAQGQFTSLRGDYLAGKTQYAGFQYREDYPGRRDRQLPG